MNALHKKKVISRWSFRRRMNKTLMIHRLELRNNLLQAEQSSSSSSQILLDTPNEIFQNNETSSSDNETLRDNDANVCICNTDEENSYNEESHILYEKSWCEELREWAIENNITHKAITELLKIMSNKKIKSIPHDSRTLLHTIKEVVVNEVPPGHYWHFGIKNALNVVIKKFSSEDLHELHLKINIDGLPISKSSKAQFWAILCLIKEINSAPLVIGIYFGHSKPNSVNEFLGTFAKEIIPLIAHELIHEDKKYKIKIDSFVCDAPARSFIKGIKGHNAYFGCERCDIEGDYFHNANKLSFVGFSRMKRTDESFRKRICEEHHIFRSVLEDIPQLDMIKSFPLDYMHLVCLGVMKKLLLIWVKDRSVKNNAKFSAKSQKDMSDFILSLRENVPEEFNRIPRGLDDLSFWKATEYRTFLLYIGPVALKDVLPYEYYIHFLLLHCAITIYMHESHFKLIDVAGKMLELFVRQFGELYGEANISYNVHNLIHLEDDVKTHGKLDSFSAFPFENNLGHIKSLLRTGNKPLQQAAKRISERFNIQMQKADESVFAYPKLEKKIPGAIHKVDLCKGVYQKIHFKNFILSTKKKNMWFLSVAGNIIQCINFTYSDNGVPVIYGSKLKNKSYFYRVPLKSSHINIYQCVTTEKDESEILNWSDVLCKLFCIPVSAEESIFFPMVHSLQE